MVGRSIDVVVTRLVAGPASLRRSLAMLSNDERGRARRLRFESDRHRFILRRARLRELLAARLEVRPESIELGYGPYGKPFLGLGLVRHGLRFNLSHCGELAVFAFSRESEVGIDVEVVRPIGEADRIAALMFSPEEQRTYQAMPPSERLAGFFKGWTRTEAAVKATGVGLANPAGGVEVTLRSFVPAPGYLAALAWSSRALSECGRSARVSAPLRIQAA